MKIIIILITVFLASCHQTDLRLSIRNNSNKSIAFRVGKLNELTGNDVRFDNAFLNIKAAENERYIVYTYWENRFSNDSVIYVVALPNPNSKMSSYCCIPEYDSLKRTGDYFYRKYSLDELVEKKWLVSFPDDGFKQGDSLLYK